MNIYLSQIQEQFVNKVNSKLEIVQKVYFQDEVFGNAGSIPPRAGESTTYTVMWQARNFYNDVSGVKIKAKLPPNVDLTGNIFPENGSSNFTFDSDSREIVWGVGDLKVSEGVEGTAAPNLSFQVRLTPYANQVGQTPEIIGEAVISGEDKWTGEIVRGTSPAVNTTLPDDQTITGEQSIVQ